MKIIQIIKDKERLNNILHEGTDPLSKKVDIIIMCAIVLCLVMASVESVMQVDDFSFDTLLNLNLNTTGIIKSIIVVLEYLFTLLFTVEYILRLYSKPRKCDYALSFFGVVDALATIPQLLSIFCPPLRYFSIFRSFRLIRIFRVFQLFTFINEGYLLLESIRKSMTKILVYFLFVVVLVCIIGMLMYVVESGYPGSPFTSIPRSIYWAIVTLTTVGYGDITPTTGLGQFLSSLVMILGYTIIAIPTGIVSANIIDETHKKGKNGRCPRCNQKTDLKANYCKHCGERL